MQAGRQLENRMSMTGRIPARAAPTALETMAVSEMGVSSIWLVSPPSSSFRPR